MNRIYICIASICLLLFACQRELSFQGGNPGNTIKPGHTTATLQGNIIDGNGQPVQGASVSAGGKTATTNTKGYFRITNAVLDNGAALATVEKSGYFKAYRTFMPTTGTNQVRIQLISRSLVATIDAAGGGEAVLSNGGKIALPAGGVVKASGNTAYSGQVKVYAAYIDPSAQNINDIIPGSFMADDQNGKRVSLASYGMMAVELESASGEKLQIAQGHTATLTMPIPSNSVATAPATISLWYVDEQSGVWKEEGSATKNGNVYTGTVKHFTYWNCDSPLPAVTISFTMKNADGVPLVGVPVDIFPQNVNGGCAHGFTDSLGQVHGLVPANVTLLMRVLDQCGNTAYSNTIGPFSQATDLGVITLSSGLPTAVTLRGRLVNCSGGAVSNGYVISYLNNEVRYTSVDAQGNFALSFIQCNPTSSGTVVGVDNAAQQQSDVQYLTLTAPLTTTGNITACGNASNQFINFTVDGTNYTIDQPGDTLLAYPADSLGTNPGSGIRIIGAPAYISFGFTGTGIGSFPVEELNVLQYFSPVTPVQPLTVHVTAYAQTIGQFYEGNFSGQYHDAAGALHSITCSFRLRRNW